MNLEKEVEIQNIQINYSNGKNNRVKSTKKMNVSLMSTMENKRSQLVYKQEMSKLGNQKLLELKKRESKRYNQDNKVKVKEEIVNGKSEMSHQVSIQTLCPKN